MLTCGELARHGVLGGLDLVLLAEESAERALDALLLGLFMQRVLTTVGAAERTRRAVRTVRQTPEMTTAKQPSHLNTHGSQRRQRMA